MSLHSFDPSEGPIAIEAQATGPSRSTNLRLILDTGATTSLLHHTTLVFLGFAPDTSGQRVTMATGSTIERASLVTLTRLSALGQHRFGFRVIAHALPPEVRVDGLLGLDFFRGMALAIDFRAGRISLT